jgi:integrase
MGLTVAKIEKLKKKPGRHLDAKGLYLQVINESNCSWLLRYERGPKQTWMGLGPLHSVPLNSITHTVHEVVRDEDGNEKQVEKQITILGARDKAILARQQLRDGIDPLAAKRSAQAARAKAQLKKLSFEAAAETYFNQHASKWRNRKSRNQFLSTLRTYCFPVIGKLPVGDIDTVLVLKCIEPHWQTKCETMTRVRARIENVLDWATVRGYRTGDNPARSELINQALPARSKVQPKVHHRALPYAELPEFMTALRGREGIAARALQFLILTAARSGEVTGARWDEIDLKQAIWVVPPGRIKAAKAHRVFLCPQAVELLKALPRERGNVHVFIGSRKDGGLSGMALSAVLDRMGRGADATVHGFRSSFRDWAAERTSYPREVAEMALAHAVSSEVEAAYRRGDLFEKRRRLMTDWCRYCSTPQSSKATATGKVVALRRGGSK